MPASRALIPRPCSIETEYGITCPDESGEDPGSINGRFVCDINPAWFDSHPVSWSPDKRLYGQRSGLGGHDYFRNRIWRSNSNWLLTNGARFYLDGAHAECSAPLCHGPTMATQYDLAGHAIIDRIRTYHEKGQGKRYVVYRNNVARSADFMDGTSVSYACHDNYTVGRWVPNIQLLREVVPFSIARMLITGSGKVGSDSGVPVGGYQISQRADFLETSSSLDTMRNRGIYNTRDVPYADFKRFRRLHVINSDSNMCEAATYLKVGLMCILLSMIEDEELDGRFDMHDPVGTCHLVSRDLEFEHPIWLLQKWHGKHSWPILDILNGYRDLFDSYLNMYHPYEQELHNVLKTFAWVIEKLEQRDWDVLRGVLDWVSKRWVIKTILTQKQKGWSDPLAAQIDIKYHDNNREKGMFFKWVKKSSGYMRIVEPADVREAEEVPPPTRSRLIVDTRNRFASNIVGSDYWEEIWFGEDERLSASISFPDPMFRYDPSMENLFTLDLDAFLAELPARYPGGARTWYARDGNHREAYEPEDDDIAAYEHYVNGAARSRTVNEAIR